MDRKTRRERILEHIGRYHFSMRPVIDKLFFDGKSCDNVLLALVNEGLVQVRGKASGLPGGWSYYQLTPEAAAQIPIPLGRTRPLTPASLEKNLAILWFCCMTEPRRARLDRRHQKAFLGGERPGDYCVDRSAPERIYRVFVVSANARGDYFLRSIRGDLDLALGDDKLADYLAAKLYGYALLVPSTAWKAKAEAALRKAALTKKVPCLVQVVPTAATLHQFLLGSPPP